MMEVNKIIAEITRDVLKELGETGHLRLNSGLTPAESGFSSGRETSPAELARMIDHTVLKPEATGSDIEKLCNEAKEYHFASVCVNPTHVKLAAKLLKNSDVKVCTVIGFPLGANTPMTKAMEVRDAIANGATEVDMVINVGALKSGDYNLVTQDIEAVVKAAAGSALTKVIIETCLLTNDEKVKACLLAKSAGADFVKTSTGFNKGGATVEDIALMRKTVGMEMGVKASGGVRDRQTAEQMVKAGATRLGTSNGVAIVKGAGSHDCINCGNCSRSCPTGNAQTIKSY